MKFTSVTERANCERFHQRQYELNACRCGECKKRRLDEERDKAAQKAALHVELSGLVDTTDIAVDIAYFNVQDEEELKRRGIVETPPVAYIGKPDFGREESKEEELKEVLKACEDYGKDNEVIIKSVRFLKGMRALTREDMLWGKDKKVGVAKPVEGFGNFHHQIMEDVATVKSPAIDEAADFFGRMKHHRELAKRKPY